MIILILLTGLSTSYPDPTNPKYNLLLMAAVVATTPKTAKVMTPFGKKPRTRPATLVLAQTAQFNEQTQETIAPVQEKPIAEKPIAEKPIAEKPIAEKPVAVQPVVQNAPEPAFKWGLLEEEPEETIAQPPVPKPAVKWDSFKEAVLQQKVTPKAPVQDVKEVLEQASQIVQKAVMEWTQAQIDYASYLEKHLPMPSTRDPPHVLAPKLFNNAWQADDAAMCLSPLQMEHSRCGCAYQVPKGSSAERKIQAALRSNPDVAPVDLAGCHVCWRILSQVDNGSREMPDDVAFQLSPKRRLQMMLKKYQEWNNDASEYKFSAELLALRRTLYQFFGSSKNFLNQTDHASVKSGRKKVAEIVKEKGSIYAP